MESLIKSFEETAGKSITCKAAVAMEAKKPMEVMDVVVAPPKSGEVRIKVVSNALCHTDIYTLEGHDPEGLFPSVLGHEATGVVESVGKDVTSVKVGDVVIPCYTPECQSPDCIFCASDKTNLCPSIRQTQGKGLMPDGTSRLSFTDGKPIYHFMGCSTFAEYSVISEISAAKIHPGADLRQMCLLGCGVSTGWGAVINNVKMEPRKSVAVFGLGTLGLSVIQASKMIGAKHIVAIDINENKFPIAEAMGATRCVVSTSDIKDKLLTEEHKWGYDYTFDCTGNVQVMRLALEVSHRGWGESCIIGVAAAGKEIATRPFQLVTGRQWKGTAFGGWKSRSEVPKLVQAVMKRELSLESYVTHTFNDLSNVNKAVEALHSGTCLRAVVNIHLGSLPTPAKLPTLLGMSKVEKGCIQQFKHWSYSCQSEMTFSIFLPRTAFQRSSKERPPVLYYLSGLTCSDDNARTKAAYAREASKYGLVVVFPDTSPRGLDIEEEIPNVGKAAGFYVNATEPKWATNYNMYDYVTKELPEFINGFFSVDKERMSVVGHSMGGHGSLICHLKNPGKYKSVSALAPICNPTQISSWLPSLKSYLGSMEKCKEYDATELMKKFVGPKIPILIDQGTDDPFYVKDCLLPEKFKAAADSINYPVTLRMQPGYDHAYFFVSSFMKDHMEFHARALGLLPF